MILIIVSKKSFDHPLLLDTNLVAYMNTCIHIELIYAGPKGSDGVRDAR
jgi:hypothetical protein